LRPRLLAIATRILGNASDGEDVVQDAWVRWQRCDRALVLNPTAFLVTTTTRLALNAAQSARARRESPVGAFLPEPADVTHDLAAAAEQREALALGIRLLRERLTPPERAAYVLRQAFAYPYGDIARLLETSEVNARQIVSRAGKRLAPLRPPTTEHHGKAHP
jgi:RNA polymerase sigma-70 factor (ECF subfamily)